MGHSIKKEDVVEKNQVLDLVFINIKKPHRGNIEVVFIFISPFLSVLFHSIAKLVRSFPFQSEALERKGTESDGAERNGRRNTLGAVCRETGTYGFEVGVERETLYLL